ncbi:MAG TPA: class I SAM-dependent methyltransferase [Bryobacteraceae bacterium]|nr:class I SAM-dependent methyltransferase [Bryobacteraceae bacterium]
MGREVSTTAEYTLLDQQLMQRAERYFAWQARLAKQQLGRRVIEVGCGAGNFTRHLVDREWTTGLDIVEECLAQARARFQRHGNVQFLRLDVQDPRFCELKTLRPDSIACLNVLEHIRDDRLALEHMRAVLDRGGRAVFLLPAFESLYGPIDHNLGHFRRYSKGSWRTLAESAGFRVKLARYFNSIGFFGWWANARIFRKEAQSPSQIEIFDRAVVPVLSRLESWIEPCFGQSIFTVIEAV